MLAPEWAEQLPLGSEVLEVDGLSMAETLKERVEPFSRCPRLCCALTACRMRSKGERGTEVQLKIRTPKGEVQEVKAPAIVWRPSWR